MVPDSRISAVHRDKAQPHPDTIHTVGLYGILRRMGAYKHNLGDRYEERRLRMDIPWSKLGGADTVPVLVFQEQEELSGNNILYIALLIYTILKNLRTNFIKYLHFLPVNGMIDCT